MSAGLIIYSQRFATSTRVRLILSPCLRHSPPMLVRARIVCSRARHQHDPSQHPVKQRLLLYIDGAGCAQAGVKFSAVVTHVDPCLFVTEPFVVLKARLRPFIVVTALRENCEGDVIVSLDTGTTGRSDGRADGCGS